MCHKELWLQLPSNEALKAKNQTELVSTIFSGCFRPLSQTAITCSKLTVETLEQGVKCVQS